MMTPASHSSAQNPVLDAEIPFWRIFQNNPRPMCVHGVEQPRLLAVNAAMVRFYGYSEAELLSMNLADLWPADHPLRSEDMPQPTQAPRTCRHRRKDAALVDVEITSDDVGAPGRPAHLLVMVDVTLRVQAEREWARLSRAQQMLSTCNEALIRASTEDALLQKTCSIAVEIGGYFGAWVGYARHDEARTIERVAFAGVSPSYALQLRSSWSEAVPEGRGAAGRSVRSGRTVVIDDILKPENTRPWGQDLLNGGVRGLISLPLTNAESTFGVLFLYSHEPIQAGPDEVQLLEELANDLAFGIAHLRARHEAQRDVQTRSEILGIQQEIALLDTDLEHAMTTIAERARSLTGADGCSIDLLEGEVLVCRARTGLEPLVPLGYRLPSNHSLAGIAVETRSTVVSEDTTTDPRADPYTAKQLVARSLIISPLCVNGLAIGVLKAVWMTPKGYAARDVENLQILVQTLGVSIQHRRMADQLRASENQYRLLFAQNPQPVWVAENISLRLLAVNQAMIEHYGYTEQELLGRSIRALWVNDAALGEATVPRHMLEQTAYRGTRRHRKKDGSVVEMLITSNPIVFDGVPARLVQATDVTSRLNSERELARLNRAQQLLSTCNEALIRATSQSDLLYDICRIAVDIGGYLSAWVGIACHDAAKSIEHQAFAGAIPHYIYKKQTSWSEDTIMGRGAAGRTMRAGHPIVVEDIQVSDGVERPETSAQWGGELRDLGVRGIVGLPLIEAQNTFGVLVLYTREAVKASPEEIKLLQELANDLAFGIGNLRAQEKQRRVQATVLKVAAAVSAHSGLEFLAQLARNMCEALGAQAAFVTRLLPGEPLRARTLAAVMDGQTVENFEYLIEGTPCEALATHSQWAVNTQASSSYPRAAMLAQMNAQAYVGHRLDDAEGKTIGQIFVLFRNPLEEQDFVLSTLQIFAARVAAEMQRQKADAHIREQAALLDKAQDAIVLRHLVNGVVYWNQSAERLYGWTAQEACGNLMADRLYKDPTEFQANMRKLLACGAWKGETEHYRKDGSLVAVESHLTLVHDEQGQPQSVLSINTDITARKAAEREIQHLAFYDQLTQLPNRLLLMDRLQHALTNSARSGRCGALLFIDLDNFKTLNDTLGHESGDVLLQQVAARLLHCVREVDTVARFGGDEFVVMLENLGESEVESALQTRKMGDKILSALTAPYTLNGFEHSSTSSIGVAPFGKENKGTTELLKQADLAMYQAKIAGRNAIRFFNPSMQVVVNARVQLELEMRQALTRQEYLLHYQPQFDAAGHIIGAEALVRWRHPRRGPISPAEFIPAAEDTGIIIALGQWVLRTACQQLKAWQGDSTTQHMSMAVNVSAKQFHHPDFVQQVSDIVHDVGVDAHGLKLELTESLLVDDLDLTIAKMSALRTLGLCFSLDDFGTGYSSLSYLKRLPLEQLKIDQSFVRDIITDVNDASIVRTIIALGQSLGLAVIAEGVETDAQRHFLAMHGCVTYQGYLFSRPLPIGELQELLQSTA